MRDFLSRRGLLALLPAACRAAPALAPADAPGIVLDSVLRQLDAADRRRFDAFAAIRTRQQVAALQEKVRRTMHAALGALPERTPLNPRQTGELTRGDIVVEKILFESRPGFYVPANVYRPKAAGGRRAAVVQSCGHYEEAKAKDDYQKACIGLAKRGFVVLIFDPIGQGERLMYRQAGGEKPAAPEHPIMGRPMLPLGRTLANYRLWDIVRALDYLEARPDVDKTRMGLLGHSGGGMMTLLTSPLEPRIRAAMSSCAVSSFYHKTRALRFADPEQIVPGVLAQGVDHPELIATVAPRAFLIGAVLHEPHLPLEGTRRTYEETKRIYEILGVPGRFGKVESGNGHQLDQNLREACYGWMLRHLADETKPGAREEEMQVEKPETLWCTGRGSVMQLEKPRAVFDLNLERSRELAKRRPARVTAAAVRSLLPTAGDPSEIEVPVTLAEGGSRRETLIVLIPERGRNHAYAREISAAFAAEGYSVLGVDLRGWGETAPGIARPDKRSTWDDYLAWSGVELGRPVLGQRVSDLLTAIRRHAGGFRKVYVAGLEGAGLVALHAAVLEPSIAGAAANRTLVSYQSVLDRPVSPEPAASLVWGALAFYDLPELARALAPRPWVAVDPYDGARRPVSGSGPIAAPEAARAMLKGLSLL